MSSQRQQRKAEIMAQVEKLVEQALELGDNPLTITDLKRLLWRRGIKSRRC
jgi:hypothetical protein